MLLNHCLNLAKLEDYFFHTLSLNHLQRLPKIEPTPGRSILNYNLVHDVSNDPIGFLDERTLANFISYL